MTRATNNQILELFQYGYRLPESDEDMIYYQINFGPLGGRLFTYPDKIEKLSMSSKLVVCYYAPNFEEVRGAYTCICLWVVHPSVCS